MLNYSFPSKLSLRCLFGFIYLVYVCKFKPSTNCSHFDCPPYRRLCKWTTSKIHLFIYNTRTALRHVLSYRDRKIAEVLANTNDKQICWTLLRCCRHLCTWEKPSRCVQKEEEASITFTTTRRRKTTTRARPTTGFSFSS